MSYLLSALGDGDPTRGRRGAGHGARLPATRAACSSCTTSCSTTTGPGPAAAALWFLQYLAYQPDAVSFSAAELSGRLCRAGFAPRPATVLIPGDHEGDPGEQGGRRDDRAPARSPSGSPRWRPGRDVILQRRRPRRGAAATSAFYRGRGVGARRLRAAGRDRPAHHPDPDRHRRAQRLGPQRRRASRCWPTSLAELSGGRFVLGLGAGSPQLAEGLHDVPFRAPVDRLATVTRQVRRLLDGEQPEPSAPGRTRPLRLAVRPAHRRTDPAGRPGAATPSGSAASWRTPGTRSCCRSPVWPGRRRLLDEGAARVPGRTIPRICPGVPTAVSADPDRARGAGLVVGRLLPHQHGPALPGHAAPGRASATKSTLVVAGEPPRGGTARLPAGAEVLLDELTVHGDAGQARAGLDRWYGAGAEMPVIVLPPNQPLDDLLQTLESLRPADLAKPTIVRANAPAP